MAIEVGMPTNFYHYTAKAAYGHQFNTQGNVSSNEFEEDDGVFVSLYQDSVANYIGVDGGDYRCTTVYRLNYGIGGINMETTNTSGNYGKIVRFRVSGKDTNNPRLRLYRDNAASGANLCSKFDGATMPYQNGEMVVHKTELACPYPYCKDGHGDREKAECVYITGISAIMHYSDGSQLDNSIIIARLPPSGKDYPVISGTDMNKVSSSGLPMYSGDVWSKDGSVFIYNDGTVEQDCVTGTTLTVVTASELSLAMSDSVLESNTGILAVACMVSGDGYARWVGYKNGVYKVYQGSKPLYGMPGERMTIKGHEFVCLAYSPFYARLS
jgi:hypothetical protein